MPVVTVVIANGAATSGAFQTGPYSSFGVLLQAALTGATCGFSGSTSQAGTYQTVKDSAGNNVSFASNAAGAVGLSGEEADALAAWPWLKLVSASNEGAERTIQLVLK